MQIVSNITVERIEIEWDPENANYSTNGKFDPSKLGGGDVGSIGFILTVKRGGPSLINFVPFSNIIDRIDSVETSTPLLYNHVESDQAPIGNPAPVVTNLRVVKSGTTITFEVTKIDVVSTPSGVAVPSGPSVTSTSIDYSMS